ncbi:MAG TPA: hypothetical protein VL985_12850 [Stellaceae bacterium]|nr:hypothetical protein [Stellaceae bacterium]
MSAGDRLRKSWGTRIRSVPVEAASDFGKAGLVLGSGTVLAPLEVDASGRPTLAIDGNEQRLLALLAIAYRRAIAPGVIAHIRRASEKYACGETALALIHPARRGLAPAR